jgi:Holliday junction resolvase RusA-like endonuclease
LLTFTVDADPVPQGSKVRSGPGIRDANAKVLAPWRDSVTAAAMAAVAKDSTRGEYRPAELPLVPEGPVALALTFVMRRPLGHYGTGRNARKLKPRAPWYSAVRPDVDKLTRAVMDSLTGVAYRDDGQVAALRVAKVYGPRGAVTVEVHALPHHAKAP